MASRNIDVNVLNNNVKYVLQQCPCGSKEQQSQTSIKLNPPQKISTPPKCLWFRWEMKYISLQTQQCGVSNYIPVCMPEMRHPQMYSVIFLQHICRQFGNGTCCCGEQVGASYSSAGDFSIYHLKVKTKRVVHCKAQTAMIWVRWFRSICPRWKEIGYYSIVITKQLPFLENTMTLW